MTIQEAFQILRQLFRTDRRCAELVGMSPQHYEALRNGRVAMPKRTADFIILKAEQAAKEKANA